MTILLDASYFLALVNEDDVHHQKSQEIAQKIDAGEYGKPFTTDHLFDEVISVTLRKFGKEKAILIGKMVWDKTYLIIMDEHLVKRGWELFQNTHLKFSFTDCLSVVACKAFQAEYLATFDKEFNKTDLQVIP